jgi:hypothetical protein
MRQTLLILALSFALAAPAAAQQLKVAFNDGLVTVDATSVPVRTILTEWAKQGGTKVVGAERITGAPLTLKLIEVPEAQALEVILRSVAGYMAAPRSTGEGASVYDRILVMATSAAPAPAAARQTPQQNPAAMGVQRFVPPPRQGADEEFIEAEDEEEDPNPPNPPVFTFPQPGNGQVQPGAFGNVPPGVSGQPVITVNPATGSPQNISINPTQQAPPGYPQMPVGSATPGMINAPPQPGSPGAPVRPPGGGH